MRIAEVGRAGEREVLGEFLDFQRGLLVRKVSGLREEEARRRLVPSETTLAGLPWHLAAVEDNWFGRVLAREAPPREGEDDTWAVPADVPVAELVAAYERACARSREIAAAYALDDVGAHPQLGAVSLRWIYVHMISETGRHVGHADILREQTDGATGVLG
jgi:hypothetical protein